MEKDKLRFWVVLVVILVVVLVVVLGAFLGGYAYWQNKKPPTENAQVTQSVADHAGECGLTLYYPAGSKNLSIVPCGFLYIDNDQQKAYFLGKLKRSENGG